MGNIKLVIIIISILSFALLVFILISRFQPGKKVQTPLPIPIFSATPSSSFQPIQQEVFNVTETSPKNGETNVEPGEITISFKTDKPITSNKSFSLDINPALPFYWKFTNAYPTNQISAQVYGGLSLNTTYTLTVKNSQGLPIYSWKFTTSNKSAQSSSGYAYDQQQQIFNSYYPLIDFVPFTSNDFDLTYNGRLTLDVKIHNPDVNNVKQEVNDWIKSKGVDPSTHTINYINAF